MSAPRTIITTTKYGLAYMPRTGIAVTGYLTMYRTIPVDQGAKGVVMTELLRRHSGDVRTVWYRTTFTVEIYKNDTLQERVSDLARVGLYGTKVQVIGTDSAEVLVAIKKILEKVAGDGTYIPAQDRPYTTPY